MADRKKADKPFEPAYKGFDEEATRNAQATGKHARDNPAAKGEWANAEYVEEGPKEAARRLEKSEEEVGEDIQRAVNERD